MQKDFSFNNRKGGSSVSNGNIESVKISKTDLNSNKNIL